MKNPYKVTLTTHGYDEKGYALACDKSGNDYKILNALDKETIEANIFKHKHHFRYGKAIKIITKNPTRKKPKDASFMETSPWQIMDFNYENKIKKDKLVKLIEPLLNKAPKIKLLFNNSEYYYRNKMEFSFYIDQYDKVGLAFHKRDSKRGKVQVQGSSLIPKACNEILKSFIRVLNLKIENKYILKGLLIRYSFTEKLIYIGLYLKDEIINFKWVEEWLKLNKTIKGLSIFLSNPKSPAFTETKELFSYGCNILVEKINGLYFEYPHNSFFQINPKVVKLTLKDLTSELKKIKGINNFQVGEYYAGIGTIGISIANLVKHVTAIEMTPNTRVFAEKNSLINNRNNFFLIEAKAEKSLELISNFDLLILDPPRAGIHPEFIKTIIKYKPKYIVYLSCNPTHQVRDLSQISEFYTLSFYRGYNFYPKTPHIEALAILKRRVDLI